MAGGPFEWMRRTPRQVRASVDEEIAFHLELRAAELERAGMEPSAAREEALRRFGNVEATRAACAASDLRKERRMGQREHAREFVQDLAHGARQLRRRPVFAAAAIGTLALGIGAATAVFSVADHVLLRPLPYADAERVVTLWETSEETGESRREVSAGNFLAWAERSRAFDALGLAEPFGFDLTGGSGPPLPVGVWLVTEDFFRAAGVRPRLGRGFLPQDYGAEQRVVVISDRLWRNRYGADPQVVGQTIELDGRGATIVGVLPPALDFPGAAEDVWAPKVFLERELEDRSSGYMRAVARLAPGVTLEQAQSDLSRVAAELAEAYPQTNAGAGVNAVPIREQIVGDVRPALLVLLGAVGFLLLIACANVAGLLIARGAERERELSVRAALGAGRGRLVRQLVTESLALALAGGAAGVLVGWLGVELLGAVAPPELPRLDALGLDGRVLGFAAVVTLLTALLFGIAPALRTSRADAFAALRSGSRAGVGRGRARLRSVLVVVEVALAMVLLVGAGLLGRSYVRLLDNELGFQVEDRAAVQLFLWDRNPTPEQRLQRAAEIEERIRSVPGVEAVGLTSGLPFHPSQIDPQDALVLEGEPDAGRERSVYTLVASEEYFRVLGIPLRRGRAFTERDRRDAPAVAMINETLARRFFPGQDPVGRRVTIGVMSRPIEREIVGVVGDVRPTALNSEPRPELFIPYAQSATGSVTFVARTRADPAGLLPALQQAVREVDPAQTVYHAATLERLVADTVMERRFNLLLLGIFSAAALLLATIGIYGLVSFATSRRRHEIGVRLALGARPRDVVGMIVRHGLGLGVPGVLLGAGGALLLTRGMESMLYGVEPSDPLTFLQFGAILLAVAAAGAYLPARRAARIDPGVALRAEE